MQINWREFFDRLFGPEGCDFAEDRSWTCGDDFRFSRKILASMGVPADRIEACLALFKEHGGHCDCEVLWKVEEHFEREHSLEFLN